MSAAVLVVHLGSYLSLCVYALSDLRTSLDDANIKAKGIHAWCVSVFLPQVGIQRRVGSRCQIMQHGCMCFGFSCSVNVCLMIVSVVI